MSDRLREALGHAIAYLIRPDMPPLSPDQRAEIANHLRRFLALTEIGPDYEAAAIEWIGADPPDNYPATRDDWEQMLDAVVEQSVKPMVDAALADYLTEEET